MSQDVPIYSIVSSRQGVDFSSPRRVLTEEEQVAMGLRYYSPEVHRAAFVLPRFARQALRLTD